MIKSNHVFKKSFFDMLVLVENILVMLSIDGHGRLSSKPGWSLAPVIRKKGLQNLTWEKAHL